MNTYYYQEFEVCIPWCVGATVHLAEHDEFKVHKSVAL